MAKIGKNEITQARREQGGIIVGAEPDQLLDLGVRRRVAAQFTREKFDPDGLVPVARGGAFVVAQVAKIHDLDIAQFFAALTPQALPGSLAVLQLAARQNQE